MVTPGRHTYTSDVTSQLKLEFDTTARYVTGHLHPFGEHIVLRNKTTGETLFKIQLRDHPQKKSVALMEEFTFEAGIPIRQGDTFELEIVYNNTTDEPTDVMGIVYPYLLDKNFQRPSEIAELASLNQ